MELLIKDQLVCGQVGLLALAFDFNCVSVKGGITSRSLLDK